LEENHCVKASSIEKEAKTASLAADQIKQRKYQIKSIVLNLVCLPSTNSYREDNFPKTKVTKAKTGKNKFQQLFL